MRKPCAQHRLISFSTNTVLHCPVYHRTRSFLGRLVGEAAVSSDYRQKMAFYVTVLGLVLLACCLQLLRTRYRAHLKSIPGPFTASISNLWKLAAVYQEDMPGWNIAVHEEYGPVVRIGPDHVSFSSPAAFQAIYTSRQAFPKVCTKKKKRITHGSTPINSWPANH